MIALILALFAAPVACPKPHRDAAVIAKFRKTHQCPTSCRTYVKEGGKFKLYRTCGRCQVDHVCALACCGSDSVDNLQWLTAEENRKKSADCSACNATRAVALRKLQDEMDQAIKDAARRTDEQLGLKR